MVADSSGLNRGGKRSILRAWGTDRKCNARGSLESYTTRCLEWPCKRSSCCHVYPSIYLTYLFKPTQMTCPCPPKNAWRLRYSSLPLCFCLIQSFLLRKGHKVVREHTVSTLQIKLEDFFLGKIKTKSCDNIDFVLQRSELLHKEFFFHYQEGIQRSYFNPVSQNLQHKSIRKASLCPARI